MSLAVLRNRFFGRHLLGGALLFYLGWLSVGASASRAQEEVPIPNHFIFPVTSPLQRDLVSSKADLIVFADSTKGLTKEGPFDVQVLQLDELRKKLQPLVKKHSHIHVCVFCPAGADDLQTEEAVDKLAKLTKQIGFQKSTEQRLGQSEESMTWAKYCTPFMKKQDNLEGKEVPMADGDVKIYPVKTPLSRYLTFNADWVAVLPPLGQDDKTIPEKVVNSLKNAFKDQNIAPTDRIEFRQRHPDQNRFETVLEDLFKIAGQLGFKHVGVTND